MKLNKLVVITTAIVIIGVSAGAMYLSTRPTVSTPIVAQKNGVTLRISEPTQEQAVDDSLTVSLSIDDKDEKVGKVEYVIDGKVSASKTKAPYGTSISTIHLDEGSHTLVVRVIGKDSKTVLITQTIAFTIERPESKTAAKTAAKAPAAAKSAQSGAVKSIPATPGQSSVPNVPDAGTAKKTAESAMAGVPRIPWEGGSAYWKASNGAYFAKADAAGWDNPSFFPITVFYGKASPEHIALLKDAGINTYAPVEHSPEIFPLTNITNQGMFAIPSGEWTQAEVGNNPNAVGWFISDECEMGYSGCDNGTTGAEAEQYALAKNTEWRDDKRSYNDGRFTMANFGNGLIRTYWAPTTMSQHVQLMDVSSGDKYTYTSPGVGEIIDGGHDAPDWPNGVPVARAYSYGWQADQMRRFQDPNKLRPIWTFVESAQPYLNESGARAIGLNEIGGAIWSAIRHEARGISYFQHNNSSTGCTGNYSIVDCPAVQAAVKAINAKVKSLAPVINTQSYYNATRVVNGFTYYYYTFNNSTDTMLKTYNGSVYIFAGLGMRCNNSSCTSGTVDMPGTKTFTLPAGITAASVEVVGESRTIPVVDGKFSDNFAAEYTDHVYKVAP